MDVGALTPFLWGFEEREKLMEFYERFAGARMHSSFIRPGGVSQDISQGLCEDIGVFIRQFGFRIIELEEMLTENRIWKQRLVDVGIVPLKAAIDYGFTGVFLRAAGLGWDLRKFKPYDCYKFLTFSVPTCVNGDCYDRFLVRIEEMRQSLSIIGQCIQFLSCNYDLIDNFLFFDVLREKFEKPSRILNIVYKDHIKLTNLSTTEQTMENLLNHFKY